MKFLKQFLIIIIISFIGEFFKYLIPLPIPASIYGLLILFTLLFTKTLKINHVKDCAYFLIDIMPIMFLPAAVGLMESFGILKPILIPFFIITILSTILVMGISGKVTEILINLQKGKKNKDDK